MRFATLLVRQDLRHTIGLALRSAGIEVVEYSAEDATLAEVHSQTFEAILVEDDATHMSHWLDSLQAHARAPFALLAVGPGGASAMSHALLHGADDYVVIADGTFQLVQRTIARASSKIQRRQGNLCRLGPFTLDVTKRTLSSAVGAVQVSPREALLGRILFENLGRVVPLERLCAELCGRTDDLAKRAVKQHAHTLRKKCREVTGASMKSVSIESVYGRGYRITQ